MNTQGRCFDSFVVACNAVWSWVIALLLSCLDLWWIIAKIEKFKSETFFFQRNRKTPRWFYDFARHRFSFAHSYTLICHFALAQVHTKAFDGGPFFLPILIQQNVHSGLHKYQTKYSIRIHFLLPKSAPSIDYSKPPLTIVLSCVFQNINMTTLRCSCTCVGIPWATIVMGPLESVSWPGAGICDQTLTLTILAALLSFLQMTP